MTVSIISVRLCMSITCTIGRKFNLRIPRHAIHVFEAIEGNLKKGELSSRCQCDLTGV
jgi:hypothetical protein